MFPKNVLSFGKNGGITRLSSLGRANCVALCNCSPSHGASEDQFGSEQSFRKQGQLINFREFDDMFRHLINIYVFHI